MTEADESQEHRVVVKGHHSRSTMLGRAEDQSLRSCPWLGEVGVEGSIHSYLQYVPEGSLRLAGGCQVGGVELAIVPSVAGTAVAVAGTVGGLG